MTTATEPLLGPTDLRKAYGPTPALDGAELTVRPGEMVAVMGPSGSGKPTLLHCLAGIVTPDAGQVRHRGRELSAMSDGERSAPRRTDFGFVFQFGQLVPELTCVENVAMPMRLGGRRRKEAEALAATWLERLEVADIAGKRPGGISGGQGQGAPPCPQGHGGGWRCPAPWSAGPGWSSPTSRPARWTR